MSEAAKPAPRAAGRAGRNTELPEHLKVYQGVWVFIEHDRGHVHTVSWELLGQARILADKLGVKVSGVLLGMSEALQQGGAGKAAAKSRK